MCDGIPFLQVTECSVQLLHHSSVHSTSASLHPSLWLHAAALSADSFDHLPHHPAVRLHRSSSLTWELFVIALHGFVCRDAEAAYADADADAGQTVTGSTSQQRHSVTRIRISSIQSCQSNHANHELCRCTALNTNTTPFSLFAILADSPVSIPIPISI